MTGAVVLALGGRRDVRCWGPLQDALDHVPSLLQQESDGALSREEAHAPRALARADRAHPGPRRRGALRGLPPLLLRVPRGMHRAAGGHRREGPRRYPDFFRINFSRCIYCGLCEEACPTFAIQLTPDYEMAEYDRTNLVYEKEDLLISGTGQVPRLQFLPGVRAGDQRQGQGRG